MKVDVIMPKMGESINEGTILKWHKKQGDPVKKDEIIFEISTDKVDTEIPSPVDGILAEIKVNEQETVDVDTVVAVIETNGITAKKEQPKTEKTREKNEEVKQPESKVKADPVQEPETVTAKSNSDNEQLIDIPMPKMGESVMEGTIIKWYKKTGERINKDEVLFEISTDKVDTDVPSPESGFLAEILVQEQETVPVGTVVAKISMTNVTASKEIPAPKPDNVQNQHVPARKPDVKDSPDRYARVENNDDTTAMVMEAFETEAPQKLKNADGKKFFSPLVLNIAEKENVSMEELQNISGSGIENRVTKKDILNYIEQRKHEVPKPKPEAKKAAVQQKEIKQAAPAEFSSTGDTAAIPMDNIRQKIMQHMLMSRDTSVHVSAMIEVDMTRIHNYIKNNKEEFLKRENIRLTYMPFISYAAIKALKEFPYINSSINGNNIVLKKYINLGFAVALEPNGLIVPNIKNADEKNIIGLAKAISDLSIKSKTKRLVPDDISNGTFTITNYGVFGTLFGTPIINQPEVAILGVGAVTKKPVIIEADGTDTIAVRNMMYLSLSHDHRLVDGMLGGKFLLSIKTSLENFDTIS